MPICTRKKLLTQSAIQRQVGCAPKTFRDKILAGVVLPDAMLITGSRRPESYLFDAERVDEIRRLISPPLSIANQTTVTI
jgi:hypothetical protein